MMTITNPEETFNELREFNSPKEIADACINVRQSIIVILEALPERIDLIETYNTLNDLYDLSIMHYHKQILNKEIAYIMEGDIMISVENVEEAMRLAKEEISRRELETNDEDEMLEIENEVIEKMLKENPEIKLLDDRLYNLIWKRV